MILVLCIFELKIALKQRLREIVVLRECHYSYLLIVHAILDVLLLLMSNILN